jgi:hypothetical protein
VVVRVMPARSSCTRTPSSSCRAMAGDKANLDSHRRSGLTPPWGSRPSTGCRARQELGSGQKTRASWPRGQTWWRQRDRRAFHRWAPSPLRTARCTARPEPSKAVGSTIEEGRDRVNSDVRTTHSRRTAPGQSSPSGNLPTVCHSYLGVLATPWRATCVPWREPSTLAARFLLCWPHRRVASVLDSVVFISPGTSRLTPS